MMCVRDFLNNSQQEPATKNELMIVAVLLSIKILLMALLLNSGFIALSVDDFSRQLASFRWSEDFEWFRTIWPPLQFWLVGSTINVYPDIRMANLLVNGIFSFLALVYFYRLTKIFFHKTIALVALATAAVLPWQLRLSISGLCEPIYHFTLFASLFYLFAWEATQKRHYLILCGLSMLAGNMLRIDGWVFYASICIYIFYRILTSKQHRNMTLVFPLILPLTFLITWILLGKVSGNYALYEADYKKTGTDLTSFYVSVLRYPIYLLLASPLVVTASTWGLVVFMRHDKVKAFRYLAIPLFYFLGLIGISIVTGSDSLAAPIRVVVPFVYLLIPIALFAFAKEYGKTLSKTGIVFLLCLLVWNISFAFSFNRNDFTDIATVSRLVKSFWVNKVLHTQDEILFERNRLHSSYYGDHIAFKVLSNHPKNVRIYDIEASKESHDKLINRLDKNKVALFVACTQSTKEYFSRAYPVAARVGTYTLYWVQQDKKVTARRPYSPPEPPRNPIQVHFTNGIKLTGFSIGYGVFPSGITTYWVVEGPRNSSPKVQYRLTSPRWGNRPLLFPPHYIGNVIDMDVYEKHPMITDHQELVLSDSVPSGEYMVDVRVIPSGDGKMESIDRSEWHGLGKVSVITNKRAVLSSLIKGNLEDYRLAAKVLASLF